MNITKKITVVYDSWNPYSEGVNYVAIRADSMPPRVWKTYTQENEIPLSLRGILIFPIKTAISMFDFRKYERQTQAR